MSELFLTIGEMAKRSGLSAKMIRHYESLGLLPPAVRSDAGYRHYQEADVQQLRFIRQARELGFSLPQIGELLNLWHDQQRPSSKVKQVAQQHIAVLEQKITELTQMKSALETLVSRCHGDDSSDCPILDELAQPSGACCHTLRT
ncbi:Cu(I)-responsive transcriptional regulator [uncultured Tolumonas sp.]|uniref:Cu(I)-responsive transcriptional regulator n=1 Tax=uncultured Tolumonas sp. TaxID=263765 RepID=UPI0037486158